MRIIHKKHQSNLAISKKGKQKNKKKRILKYFQGAARISDNYNYCLIFFSWESGDFGASRSPKTKSFVRVVMNFLFYFICFVAKWQKLALILLIFKNADINGDVRDAPPLFPRVQCLPTPVASLCTFFCQLCATARTSAIPRTEQYTSSTYLSSSQEDKFDESTTPLLFQISLEPVAMRQISSCSTRKQQLLQHRIKIHQLDPVLARDFKYKT